MIGYKLTLESDDDDREVCLITESTCGVRQREVIRLREGFGLDDVRGAIVATGCVKQEGNELRFTSANHCLYGKALSDVLEEIFSYFDAPDTPTSELLEVQSAVARYEMQGEPPLEIPPYAYAWLDVLVREDIADQARRTKEIWTESSITFELEQCCEHRVAELVTRYSHSPDTRTAGRLAASIPTRNPNIARGTKTG